LVLEMRIITVKIPESYLEGLEELVNTGRYSSRSEAIRAAIRELLRKELWDIHNSRNGERDREEEEKRGRVVRITV